MSPTPDPISGDVGGRSHPGVVVVVEHVRLALKLVVSVMRQRLHCEHTREVVDFGWCRFERADGSEVVTLLDGRRQAISSFKLLNIPAPSWDWPLSYAGGGAENRSSQRT